MPCVDITPDPLLGASSLHQVPTPLGTPTIPVPATGGHLHTGAGVATLGTGTWCHHHTRATLWPRVPPQPPVPGGTQVSGR